MAAFGFEMKIFKIFKIQPSYTAFDFQIIQNSKIQNFILAINTLFLRGSILKSVNFMKLNMENWSNNFSLSGINYPLLLSGTSV